MCTVNHGHSNKAKPHQLALFFLKKSLDDVIGTQQSACEATLQYLTVSKCPCLYLQKVLMIHLKKCVFNIIY